uniref:Uncharacterized protein n=1 Tax=Anopheles merus TaxID=30066 RepID=A0A182V9B5_ANOME
MWYIPQFDTGHRDFYALATGGTAQRTVGAASQQLQPLPGARATVSPLARVAYVRYLPADAQLGWDGPLHHHADSPVAAQDAHERGPGAPDVPADAVHHAVRLDRVQHLVHGDQLGQVVQGDVGRLVDEREGDAAVARLERRVAVPVGVVRDQALRLDPGAQPHVQLVVVRVPLHPLDLLGRQVQMLLHELHHLRQAHLAPQKAKVGPDGVDAHAALRHVVRLVGKHGSSHEGKPSPVQTLSCAQSQLVQSPQRKSTKSELPAPWAACAMG